LQHFDLKAEDYLPKHGLTMEDILQDIQTIGKEAVERNTYKKGLKDMATKYRRFLDAVEAPTTLSREEALGLSDMRMYLKRNAGHAFGFFKYRKERYEDEVGRFSELCLAYKMHLLANKEVIMSYIESEIKRLQHTMMEEQDLRRELVCARHQKQKNDWGTTYVQCECGREYTRSNKCKHEQTKKHREWVRNSALHS
jgi:hypothetical protein